MSATTPKSPSQTNHKRSNSRPQTPPPRPETPLRPPSRSSLRSSHTPSQGPNARLNNPIASLEPAFAELADGMADLEANFMHMQLLHESLARFSECFAAFLYGMNVNAFCVDFPEAPVAESFRRAYENPQFLRYQREGENTNALNRSTNSDPAMDPDQTILTTDTSFVENPPASSAKASASSKFSTPSAKVNSSAARGTRGGATTSTRGGSTQRGRGSGLARASSRGRGGTVR